MVAAGNDFLECEDGGVATTTVVTGGLASQKKIAAYLPLAVAFVLFVGMGYCVLGPFVADHVHGHVHHLNHQQPMQKAAFAPMQLTGRQTRHSAPVTANKIAMGGFMPVRTARKIVGGVDKPYHRPRGDWSTGTYTDGKIGKGKVQWFDSAKGFGFITAEGGGGGFFVLRKDIYARGIRSLADGEDVEFVMTTDPFSGDPRAIEVTGPEGSYVKGASEDGKLAKGKVKWFDSAKGFGFITAEGGGSDFFVHQKDIYAQGFRSLADGEDVEFVMTTDPISGEPRAVEVTGPEGSYVKGPSAEHVRNWVKKALSEVDPKSGQPRAVEDPLTGREGRYGKDAVPWTRAQGNKEPWIKGYRND